MKPHDSTEGDHGSGEVVGVDRLMDWLLGALDDSQASHVDALVAAGDWRVMRTLDWLRWLAYQAPLVGTERPPPHLSERLVGLFDGRSTATSSVPEAMIDHVLELLFDSRHDLALAGTRGPDAGGAGYRLAFTCDAADVVLQIRPSGPGLETMRGQVLVRSGVSDDQNTATTHMIATVPGSPVDGPTAAADALGRFVLHDVPTGASPLRITGELLRLVVHLPGRTPKP